MSRETETTVEGDPVQELGNLLFRRTIEPQYVLDAESKRFLVVNEAFESLFGYTLEDLQRDGMTSADLVHPDDRTFVEERQRERGERPEDRYGFRICTRSGQTVHVEVSVREVPWRGRRVAFGVLRDVTERIRLEERLKNEASLQRSRTMEAYQSNVRLFQLTEKVRAAYVSTTELVDCRTVPELLAKSVEVLTKSDGLDYAGGVFYLTEGEELVAAASSEADVPKRIDLGKGHPYARLLRGEIPPEEVPVEDGRVVPLPGREGTLGLLVVRFHAADTIRTWQENILLTLTGSIALLLDNIRLYEEVERQSVVDSLTGLFNRRFFDRKLADEFERAKRYRRDLTLVMLDIDDFKQINDTFGHLQGDAILSSLGTLLGGRSRAIDVVCRYGGEEFALLLPETSGRNGFAKAEKIRQDVAATDFPNLKNREQPFHITVSLGVSEILEGIETPQDLIGSADEALYAAKRAGKNTSEFRGHNT